MLVDVGDFPVRENRGSIMTAISKHATITTLTGSALGLGLFIVALGVAYVASFAVPMSLVDRKESSEQKLLLEKVDHAAVLLALRDYAARQHWNVPESSGAPPTLGDGTADLSKLPPELQRLKPRYVWIDGDSIDLVYGGALGHWGLRAFRPGVAGSGKQRLVDGLWFFTDDDDSARAYASLKKE
jgi:hypothetical protein